MTRTVTDAALLLSVLAGKDDADPATAKQPPDLDTDYPAQLRVDGLRGARIGVLRSKFAATSRTTPSALGPAAPSCCRSQRRRRSSSAPS